MNIDHRTIVRRVLVVIGFLVLIPVFALGALAVSARFSDRRTVCSIQWWTARRR